MIQSKTNFKESKSKSKKSDLPHPLNVWSDDCMRRVNHPHSAFTLWNTVLSEEEKRELIRETEKMTPLKKRVRKAKQNTEIKHDLKFELVCKHFLAVDMFKKTRGIDNRELAAVKLGEEIECITPMTAKRLHDALGERSNVLAEDKPSWDRVNGCIMYRGQAVRKIQNRRIPSNHAVLLQRFEENNWDQRIDSPPDWDNCKLGETLRSLNYRLKCITFEIREGGGIIQWRVALSKRQ